MFSKLVQSDLQVSRVGLGLWPIAGMTTLETSESESLATIEAAVSEGINFFDTAFCYGVDGISERLLGKAVAPIRDQVVIATKCGVHWAEDLSRVNDASPKRLRYEFQTSLSRLNTDYVDLLYLHSPDRVTPIEDSAQSMARILETGQARAIGLSNATIEETRRFHAVCPLSAIQPRYNMFQREIEQELIPWAQDENVAVVSYWPLMKGLLAGKIRRNHEFDPRDKRLSYPIFQPPLWDRAQNLLDDLEQIANSLQLTIAQLVVAWTLAQPGITATLCGAKRPWQIAETAAAMRITLPPSVMEQINQAITKNLD